MVFALQRTADGDLVTALDLTEGRPVWSSTARSQGYLSTDRSRVYTVSAERGHEGTLLALDATSGVERWRFDPPNGRGTRGKVVPAGARVLWTAGSELWALDTLSGAAVWHVGVQSGSVSEPVHVMDRVLVVCGNELLCLDLVSGARVWTALIADEAPVLARAQMSFSDNRLFVSHTGNGLSGHVTCVDAGDGAVVWDRSGVSAAHITACGSMVYVRGGDVSALDASTGQTVWSVAAEGCSPLYCLYGSVVFADASREDALAVLDGLTGAPRRHLALPNACAGFVPTPTSLGLVADNNGVLHAIDTRRAFGAI
jgi:outer membrane protein assembly factor BamB